MCPNWTSVVGGEKNAVDASAQPPYTAPAPSTATRTPARFIAASLAAGDRGLHACVLQRRLRGGETGERDAERRAGHVVEPDAVAERDRVRLAAVLAADAELEILLRTSPPRDGDPHQVADTALVEHLERVPFEHVVLEVGGEELPLRVVPREAERRLRQVVGAEGEE